ncbi:hypothetical protein DITRI_Ditri03aG0205900 [Diplodiscus trichospermus]
MEERVTDWRNLFSPAPNQTLHFFPPEIFDGKPIVSPPSDIFEEGVDMWQNRVVA